MPTHSQLACAPEHMKQDDPQMAKLQIACINAGRQPMILPPLHLPHDAWLAIGLNMGWLRSLGDQGLKTAARRKIVRLNQGEPT